MRRPVDSREVPRGAESIGDCRAVLLTPEGRGAVATIVVHGCGAVRAVESNFRSARNRPLSQLPAGRPWFGRWVGSPETGAVAAEEVVVCRRDEATVEVHCHGGRAATARLLEDLGRVGAQLEQDRWAWACRDLDPLAAAAARALTQARTRRTAAILLDQYHGALRDAVRRVQWHVVAGLPEAARDQLRRVCRHVRLGLHLTQPWRVVLAGAPNVGKSSLANAALGYRRAIVFDQPGTTRDAITAATALDGWPVEFVDTAGLRESDCPIEAAGVARSRQHAQAADLVVLVFDGGRAWSAEDRALWEQRRGALVLHNKSDLRSDTSSARPPGLWVSARTGAGLPRWLTRVARRLVPRPPEAGEAVPFTPEQAAGLTAALEAAERDDWQSAQQALKQLNSSQ